MSYLAAYRQGSRKYGTGGDKHSNSPSPYKPSTKPAGANDNSPRPANDNRRRPSLRPLARLARLHPAARLMLIAFDNLNLVRRNEPQVYGHTKFALTGGWTIHNQCFGVSCPQTSRTPETHMSIGTIFSCTCGTQPTPSWRHISDPRGLENATSIVTWHYNVPGTISGPLAAAATYRRVGTGAWQAWRKPVWTMPKPMPVIDPHLLPIMLPMQLPLPHPAAVPRYFNDPLGSQRTNGDVRPRFVVRGPPPLGTKEKKLRAIGAYAAIAQKAMQATTEGLDYLDALHDALPDKFKARPKWTKELGWRAASPQAKARALYDNFDQINWNEAVKNLIFNEVGDRILGRANAKADKFLNNTPFGRITRGVAF